MLTVSEETDDRRVLTICPAKLKSRHCLVISYRHDFNDLNLTSKIFNFDFLTSNCVFNR